VIEAKPPARAVDDTAASAQIDRYWQRYKPVLVTNLRDWLLIGEREGRRVHLERFTLAATEPEFWALAEHPQAAQTRLGAAFADFLARALTHAAPLAAPRHLATLLASYAREALHRVDAASPAAQTQLEALKASLQDALGAHFTGGRAGTSSAPPWFKPCSTACSPPGCCATSKGRARQHGSTGAPPPTICTCP